jgi:capsular polysaccharide biosynthesis protein
MSQQVLDARRSIQIVRRHRVLIGFVMALGIIGGGFYALHNPPMVTSTALVVIPQTAQNAAAAAAATGTDPYTATQQVIAESNQVLSRALPDVRPAMSLTELHRNVEIGILTPYVLSVSAKAETAADAEATANAVARSYIQYIGSANSPVGKVSAQLLEPATTAAGTGRTKLLVIYAFVAAIAGALIGVILALAISRSDRRLRERDEIANSIGVPVIASFPVGHPVDAAGWSKLLQNYKPGALHALHLRRALQLVGMAAADANGVHAGGRWSVAVLSLSSDPGAFALGPQLAVFAASQGISTALVIGPQQDMGVTATLRTACAVPPTSPSKLPNHLQVRVCDTHVEAQHDASLTVVVVVVDGWSPRMPDGIRTGATVLGVSAAAATAEQLARVAVSAAADGHEITGIIVADPEPTDRTTGRIPQLRRMTPRSLPTRLNGMTTEIRR